MSQIIGTGAESITREMFIPRQSLCKVKKLFSSELLARLSRHSIAASPLRSLAYTAAICAMDQPVWASILRRETAFS